MSNPSTAHFAVTAGGCERVRTRVAADSTATRWVVDGTAAGGLLASRHCRQWLAPTTSHVGRSTPDAWCVHDLESV